MMQAAAHTLDTRGDAADPVERARAAPAPALFPPPAPPLWGGDGAVHAHHGEIVQGVFYSSDGTLEHGLVTLPCRLFGARARFRPLRSGPLTVEPADRSRARTAARMTLDALGRTGWGGSLRIESGEPLRWGCGSSTADVLATMRAVADAFGTVLPPEWIARLSVDAETASDSLMYGPERAVLFAQRRGCVLRELGWPLFMGPTSGASYLVADWWARENPDSLTAVVLPDEGYRYQDTVYNDAWLDARGLRLDVLPRQPVEWDRPHDGDDAWPFHRWGRRPFGEVMNAPAAALELVPA